MKNCVNPHCREMIQSGKLCPSCKYVGRLGIFVGGMFVGIVLAILKLLNVFCQTL